MQLLSSVSHSRHPFYAGFIVSFIASLPPGMVNVVMVELAVTRGYAHALWFTLGTLVIEIIVVKICLTLMQRMLHLNKINRILQVVTIVTMAALSVASFVAASDESGDSTMFIENSRVPFVLGMITMAMNPGLLPFWFGWTAVLVERKLIDTGHRQLVYISGIALGSLLADAIFITSGGLLFSSLTLNGHVFYFVFGCLFLVMTIVYAIKMFFLKPVNR